MNATTLVDCPFCDAPTELVETDGAAGLRCADCGIEIVFAADPQPDSLDRAA